MLFFEKDFLVCNNKWLKYSPKIKIKMGIIIELVKSHKLLGIHIDQDLDFDAQ